MTAWAVQHDGELLSCDLLRTELIRAVRRTSPDRVQRARQVLDSLFLLTVPTELFERAALLEPSELRSLDALHLAAALDAGDELDGFVTYDDRLATAAVATGMAVLRPG